VSYLEDLFSLEGKRALVTGGAGGIGAACAKALAGAGATVALSDLEDASERLRERAAEVQETSDARVLTVTGDVTDQAEVARMIQETVEQLGGIDIVHSNAGVISGLRPDLDNDYAAWKRNLDINLGGMFLVGREAARQMVRQGTGGSIINTASMSGTIINRAPGEPANGSAYSAAKAGVIQLTRSQAVQWVGHGIRVNAISPGYVRSGIHRGWGPEKFAAREELVPMGRFGEVDEIAGAIVYLASGASSYVTGANLVVDGGYTCW
jgi:NAD(P)-dependent dehydrogenase (short-subunit alcohol dehydrogenase family)